MRAIVRPDEGSGEAGMKVQCRVGVALLAFLIVAAGDSRLCARQAAWQPSPGHTQVPIWPGVIPDAQPVNGPEVGTVVDAAGKPKLIALFGAEEGRRSRGDARIYEWRARVWAATVFRRLEAGEQRLEGMLEQIECRGASAVFHVRAVDGLVRLTAPRMSEVDFITYRDDVSGAIACGPLATPLRVYVAWKPGSTSDARVAVAIEFLPKD
jgi:hypothetical protein